ncbi:MAG TPA: LemA family protein [Thermodesulfobacteriota bacterium]|nr:LemA family protein [Deltaproteobacteria bacterium]HNR13838.1 LemA family protein [Thermodesulfobacteriota bacterium]
MKYVAMLMTIFGALIFSGCGTYNKLVDLDEGVKEAWAQVETQLQRRYDLVPNLVETVKGYAAQEKEVFIQVTEARSKVGRADTIPEKIEANNQLTSALGRLLVVVEQYPELKSNQNFIRLQDELAGTENRIAVARRRYNEAVRQYNVATRRFPSNLIANAFGFEKAAFYEAQDTAEQAPKVEF